MAVKRYYPDEQAYGDTLSVPKRYDPESGAYVETTGKAYDPDAEAWEKKWGSKKILFGNGSAEGMGGYTISTHFIWDSGSFDNAGTVSCKIENGLLKLYVNRAIMVKSAGIHMISNNYLSLEKYSNLYIQIDSGYIVWDGNMDLGIKTDKYLEYYNGTNKSPNTPILIYKNEGNDALDLSGLYCLPIVNTDPAKLVISLYTNAGSYNYNKELSINISKIWME
ncbi:MAG: hypothetical protein J6C00_13045 [Eubacterium sp.]|nr:hypothetical protein [Eubacterium sp.]